MVKAASLRLEVGGTVESVDGEGRDKWGRGENVGRVGKRVYGVLEG